MVVGTIESRLAVATLRGTSAYDGEASLSLSVCVSLCFPLLWSQLNEYTSSDTCVETRSIFRRYDSYFSINTHGKMSAAAFHLVLVELDEVSKEGRKVSPVSLGPRPAPKPGWRRSWGGLVGVLRGQERVRTEDEGDEELGK